MASTRSRDVALLDGAPPPRLRVAPSARSNSWEDVSDLAATLGVPMDEWQDVVLEAAMGERANGQWSSKFVGVSAPRQNGKSQLIVARALAGILLFGEKLIIISAHETDTARQIWRRLTNVIEENPTLEARLTGRMDAINREFLAFGEGLDRQEIRLKARGKSGSRGFSADCLLLDEAQILGKDAWGSILPTMAARPNPQLWLFGTPPTEADDPYAFTRVRDSSRAGTARHTWVEWSAAPDADFDDVATWAAANPAFGLRGLTADTIADERANMEDDQFGLERLGIWPDDAAGVERAVDLDAWHARSVPTSADDWPLAAIGLDMDPVSGRLWLAVGAHSPSGVHVELLPMDLMADGTDAAVAWLRARARRRVPLVLPADSPAMVLQAPLLAAGCKVYPLNHREQVQASASFEAGVREGTVSHLDDPVLEVAVSESSRERSRTAPGQWKFKRGGSLAAAPLYAVAGAAFGAIKWAPRRLSTKTEGGVCVL